MLFRSDFTTPEGAILALKSPANNVRWSGFQALKNAGAASFDGVSQMLSDTNPFVSARAIWLLPYLGEKGITTLGELLKSDDEKIRLTAFRAIRRSDLDALSYAKQLATDKSSVVRAEAAMEMRYRTWDDAKDVLVAVAKSYDGKDRSYLESLGLGAGHNTEPLWATLKTELKQNEPTAWSDEFARLTWRLMPKAAVAALAERGLSPKLSEPARKLAVDSIAFVSSREAADALISLVSENSPVKDQATWWLRNRNEGEWSEMGLAPLLKEKGIMSADVKLVAINVPPKPETLNYTVDQVLALKGDAVKGKALAGRCVMCHSINGQGPEYGPALKGFAQRQPAEVVARSIVNPSYDISHGYDGHALELTTGEWIDGQILGDGATVKIRSTGGLTQDVPKDMIRNNYAMDRSLMLSADQLGLSAQDVADIVEWMKSY